MSCALKCNTVLIYKGRQRTISNLTEADIVSMVKADAMLESETVLSDTDYHEGNEIFQEQSPDEVFTSDELNVLRRKISTFEYLIDKAKKQSLLDCYLEK
ncbi:7920_t:CDS:2 [Ambispora leptoticha]|uniref:7920_t:CDS:1 n=1 Tax=Ambispora leptoticha TaxID=144679 RepID=A0A9N8VFD3_9GLOM|nr:7920_t:CDS:2 [Ambispora leptoticha]